METLLRTFSVVVATLTGISMIYVFKEAAAFKLSFAPFTSINQPHTHLRSLSNPTLPPLHLKSTTMSSSLVFITGATGFIGASTALAALKAGYRLRISVRKESQIESLKNLFSDHANNLEFVVIPDITVPGAFSKVLDNVEYILHLASPLAVSVDKDKVYRPAIEGTLNILRDAAKVPSIKKVVITSSMAAFTPLEGPTDGLVLKG